MAIGTTVWVVYNINGGYNAITAVVDNEYAALAEAGKTRAGNYVAVEVKSEAT